MPSRFIDFDAERAERRAEPILLRAFGRDFELPGSMSAALFLDILRIQEERGAESDITFNDAVGILRRVLPADVLDALLANDDFSQDDYIALCGIVVQAYGDSGESPAPNRAERRNPPATSTRSRGSQGGSKSSPRPASPGAPTSQTGA